MKSYSFIGTVILLSLFFIISSVYHTNTSVADTNAIRVVSLGDSITFGTGDPLKKGYIIGFKEKYEQKIDTKVELSNYGIPKYTTEDIILQLQEKDVRENVKKATYITLYIGTNDFRKSAQYKFDNIDVSQMESGKHKYLENLSHIYHEIRALNRSAPIFTMGLYDPYTDFYNHQQLLKLINSWNNDIEKITHENNHAFFVPTIDIFQGQPKKKYFADSLHLNRSGYHMLANRLYDSINLYENQKFEDVTKKIPTHNKCDSNC